MALSADRNTPRATGDVRRLGLAASALIYAGALVCRNAAGYAVPGAEATGLHGVGVALERVDNDGGSAGDQSVDVREGIYRWNNSSSGDAITIADIGGIAWVVDDQTVAKTSAAGTRSPAGLIVGVDSRGVEVAMGEAVNASFGATRKVYVQANVATLVGANSYHAVSPIAGKVTKLLSVTQGVLTTGDATLTGKIGGVAITGGVITITQAGSAAGDIDVATPSALNVVDVGSLLSATVGGSNATASAAIVLFEITP